MAEVSGRPFLEVLLRQLRRYGFERVILAVGYQKEVIRQYFGERALGLDLVYSPESFPLGTGGAIRNAADLVESDSVLVMNGDSYTDADLGQLVISHHDARADASVVLTPTDGRADCGSVRIEANSRVVSFEEKKGLLDPSHTWYVNAGIYMISRPLLFEIPAGVEVSIERKFFPGWVRKGKFIQGFICSSGCLDIGTPERYRTAQDLLACTVPQSGACHTEGQS
jgi:mannose-1-phosphate guanylyltransferase